MDNQHEHTAAAIANRPGFQLHQKIELVINLKHTFSPEDLHVNKLAQAAHTPEFKAVEQSLAASFKENNLYPYKVLVLGDENKGKCFLQLQHLVCLQLPINILDFVP